MKYHKRIYKKKEEHSVKCVLSIQIGYGLLAFKRATETSIHIFMLTKMKHTKYNFINILKHNKFQSKHYNNILHRVYKFLNI